MKRIGILLAVFVVLAWIGVKLNPSAPESGQTTTEVTTPQAEPARTKPVKPRSPAEEKAQQEKWFGAETIVAAKRAVQGALKDPSSAQFKDVRANYTEEFGVVACGRVNAKNELGGYIGFKRFVSSGKSVILEGRDSIGDAWVSACL
ncbi:MAG: hypothetical protein ACRBBM_13770 [Pseudomonadaceae bacterium]